MYVYYCLYIIFKIIFKFFAIYRRAFMNLASTPEAFIVLRSHCIKTLATVNICQYILGIGDRHLSNFMVDMQTGAMVGIDFGHSFHSATQVGR